MSAESYMLSDNLDQQLHNFIQKSLPHNVAIQQSEPLRAISSLQSVLTNTAQKLLAGHSIVMPPITNISRRVQAQVLRYTPTIPSGQTNAQGIVATQSERSVRQEQGVVAMPTATSMSGLSKHVAEYTHAGLQQDIIAPSSATQYQSRHANILQGFVQRGIAGAIPTGLPQDVSVPIVTQTTQEQRDTRSDKIVSAQDDLSVSTTQQDAPTMKHFMHIFDDDGEERTSSDRIDAHTLPSIPGLEFLPAISDDITHPPKRDILAMEDFDTLTPHAGDLGLSAGLSVDSHDMQHGDISDISALAEKLRGATLGRPAFLSDDDESSAEEDHGATVPIVSETMAKIYEQQGAIAQAISAYQFLAEQDPSRSDEFRARIQALQNKSTS